MTMKLELRRNFGAKYRITESTKRQVHLSKPKSKLHEQSGGGSEEFIFPVKILKANNVELVENIHSFSFDPWPAYASNRTKTTSQIYVSPTGNLRRQEKDESKLPGALKPKLLTMIEAKISRDILKNKIPNDVTHPRRLQMYKEAFDMLIARCIHYGSLLTDIKSQYDNYIVYLHKKIDKLLPLKTMLTSISNDCEHKIMRIKEKESNDIKRLEAFRKSGLDHAHEVKERRIELLETVKSLKEQLATETHLKLIAADSNKLSIVKAADLNNRLLLMESLVREQKNIVEEGDSVRLKIALDECQKTLEKTTVKVMERETFHKQTVLLTKYEDAVKELNESRNLNTRLSEEISGLKNRHNLLQDHCANLATYRDLYFIQCGYTLRVVGSRGEWNQKMEYIGLLLSKWKRIISEKSIEELTILATDEMTRYDAGGLPTLSRGFRAKLTENRSSFT